jgi:hypothetical protein
VVLHCDIQQAATFGKLARQSDVLLAGAQLAAGVVMAKHHGGSTPVQRLFKNDLGVGNRTVHAALTDPESV